MGCYVLLIELEVGLVGEDERLLIGVLSYFFNMLRFVGLFFLGWNCMVKILLCCIEEMKVLELYFESV